MNKKNPSYVILYFIKLKALILLLSKIKTRFIFRQANSNAAKKPAMLNGKAKAAQPAEEDSSDSSDDAPPAKVCFIKILLLTFKLILFQLFIIYYLLR